MTIFVDDINLPQQDQFNSQPALEVLRQYIDSGGFYDVKSYAWKVNVYLAAADFYCGAYC